jgi:hypothetical protein
MINPSQLVSCTFCMVFYEIIALAFRRRQQFVLATSTIKTLPELSKKLPALLYTEREIVLPAAGRQPTPAT